MTFENGRDPADPVLENIRGTYDAINVKRVFGEPYQVNGLTVIPVARVAGGAGGGGGQGTNGGESGKGFGTGFGVHARPVGVYEVRGRMSLPEICDRLDFELSDEEYEDQDTIGGHVTARLGRLPSRGDSVNVGPFRATVLDVSRRRVQHG